MKKYSRNSEWKKPFNPLFIEAEGTKYGLSNGFPAFNPLFIEAKYTDGTVVELGFQVLSILFSLRHEERPALQKGTQNSLSILFSLRQNLMRKSKIMRKKTFNPLFIEASKETTIRDEKLESFQSSFH